MTERGEWSDASERLRDRLSGELIRAYSCQTGEQCFDDDEKNGVP